MIDKKAIDLHLFYLVALELIVDKHIDPAKVVEAVQDAARNSQTTSHDTLRAVIAEQRRKLMPMVVLKLSEGLTLPKPPAGDWRQRLEIISDPVEPDPPPPPQRPGYFQFNPETSISWIELFAGVIIGAALSAALFSAGVL